MTETKDWFASWFNTSYYHTLYKHRDFTEGQAFMQQLVTHMKLSTSDHILDLACGKGRHAIYLNSLGYQVTGADLSSNNIKFAKQYENERLRFVEHDMREPLNKSYDAILNLFTSFGFFDDDAEDINILRNIRRGLKPNGRAVIDFMNVRKVRNELISKEELIIDDLKFSIRRYLKDNFIIKEINITDGDVQSQYFEKVKNLDLEKFKSFSELAGLNIVEMFGNYNLEPFDETSSERLILILK